MLAGVSTPFLLVEVRVVPATQLEGVHVELARECVHRTLEAERALDVARRTERAHRAGVDVDERLRAVNVRAPIELVIDLGRASHPATDSERDGGVEADRGERPVACRA